MELLLASVVALAGYGLSRSSSTPPRHRPRNRVPRDGRAYTESDETVGPTLEAAHAAAAAARWAAGGDPATTGILRAGARAGQPVPGQPAWPGAGGNAAAPAPFLTSAKSQNFNPAVAQRRMELFTGAVGAGESASGTWRPKREARAFFSPAAGKVPVTSGGTAGNPALPRDVERFVPASRQNNVLPFEQVRVGRGVGVGADVATAGGFHPMLRIVPKNVGEYKRNQLPGGVNVGASRIQKAALPSRVTVNHNAGALVYDQERRPMMPSQAAVLAPWQRTSLPEDPGLAHRKPYDVDRFGNPSRAGTVVRAGGDSRYPCGDDPDRNHHLPVLNAGVERAGVGAFAHATFDGSRMTGDRRDAPGGNGGFLAGPGGARRRENFVAPPTQRDLTRAPPPVGGVGVIRGPGEVRRPDVAKHTLRERQNAAATTGVIGAVLGGTMDNVWRYRRLGRPGTKPESRAFTPGAGRMNVMVGPGAVAQRDRDERQPASLEARVPLNAGARPDGLGDAARPSNALPSANPRLQDLGLATRQLAGNPFAKSLWDM